MTSSKTTNTMTTLARATRAFTATLAIVGVSAVLASVQPARAADRQVGSAGLDDEINRQVAGPAYAVAAPAGPFASAHQYHRIEASKAAHKDFQDIK